GDPLKVKVNKLASTRIQLPYSYYSLPYCKPDRIVDSAKNHGEVLGVTILKTLCMSFV
ncbi:unnamed protein product, partial [Cuscuta campestris]